MTRYKIRVTPAPKKLGDAGVHIPPPLGFKNEPIKPNAIPVEIANIQICNVILLRGLLFWWATLLYGGFELVDKIYFFITETCFNPCG